MVAGKHVYALIFLRHMHTPQGNLERSQHLLLGLGDLGGLNNGVNGEWSSMHAGTK